MNPDYWIKSWNEGRTSFHCNRINDWLIKSSDYIKVANNRRVLVPLCGKTQDILWLYKQGFNVTGIELSSIACQDFFKENGLDYITHNKNGFICYQHDKITLYCVNLFDFTADREFDVIYDHKSLVALPFEMRQQYAICIMKHCSPNATILLFTCELDNAPQGPPFSVDSDEITQLYGKYFDISLLNRQQINTIPEKLAQKGCTSIWSSIHLLTARSDAS